MAVGKASRLNNTQSALVLGKTFVPNHEKGEEHGAKHKKWSADREDGLCIHTLLINSCYYNRTTKNIPSESTKFNE